MQIKYYCDLYMSEKWVDRKVGIMKRLKKKKIPPSAYLITLSQGEQNHLEFFSGLLLKQHVFDHAGLFVVGIADGYLEALSIVEQIAERVYTETGGCDIRNFLLQQQRKAEGAKK